MSRIIIIIIIIRRTIIMIIITRGIIATKSPFAKQQTCCHSGSHLADSTPVSSTALHSAY